MSEPLLIARTPDTELFLLPGMANRHGLITGATGTGKTVTLQKLAESLSEIGVPVFMADVKGDLTGIAQAGTASEKLLARLKNIGVNDWQPHANPVVVWDIFGEKGHPVRATVIAPCSRMGPVTEDERNGLINHSPVYGKYEDDVDRESAYEMLQKGFQASTEQQNNPPAKGKEVAVDDGILGGLKDILFGTTGPRGGKKDGVVQTMAKSAARQVTNQIVRGMLGSLLGGRRR
ncbi:TPA: helicase HerA-like domain-containing protein [Escherichia coli]|uniref:helicase HerA-like domain-containing protein n=1 Tax=Escherichia coli TaxID=562 RepID=UPI000BDE907C|nr:helicase HerA-like domain-containing protein [Escherichia coli]EFH8843172.1 DUF853 family protein [Escherichia coli]EFM8991670.1 DUF853 family protein [Escherichia coli]EGC2480268.1 DUF853 family protein [Escherichia coli]MBB9243452.1 DUF853 family protein [Escherichia coli]HBB0870072.1 DUF853 family protein [Escherichia coli]